MTTTTNYASGFASRLDNIERSLPASLPAAYRAWLVEADHDAHERFLGPWRVDWELSVRAFQREWHPLGNRLLPVEHLGDGMFACLWLGENREAPVIAWDVAADLGEQPLLMLAANWTTYVASEAARNDQVREALAEAVTGAEVTAAKDLERRLSAFSEAVERFHRFYQEDHHAAYEHDAENARIEEDEWKPERFAVQDHLIGVMVSRFHKGDNTIDVAGFATRDHTNFARGSATAGLLTGLLCDCAAKSAAAVRFIDGIPERRGKTKTGRIAHEVIVLAGIHGIDLQAPTGSIPAAEAGRLLLALTPIAGTVRRALVESAADLLRVGLAVNKQIWSGMEASLLARWSPVANAILYGSISASEPVRLLSALAHGRSAMLVGFATQVIDAAAEVADVEGEEIELEDRPYTIRCRVPCETRWTDAASGTTFSIGRGTSVLIVGCPVEGAISAGVAAEIGDKVQGVKNGAEVLVIVPARTRIERGAGLGARFVSADQDVRELDEAVHDKLVKARRLRS